MRKVPTCIAGMALRLEFTGVKLVGGLPMLSKREPALFLFTLRAHQHSRFPSMVSRTGWQTKVFPKPRKLSFLQAQEFSPLQMANLNQIENLRQKTCYDWGESACWELAPSPGFSREIRAAKMFKSPARIPDLIWFYSSRDCLVVVSLYHIQS